MENFVGYWISITEDCGQLLDEEGDIDLYLKLSREWWSPDGKFWERQPDRYTIFTEGTSDPLGTYSEWEQVTEYFDSEYLEINDDDHPLSAVWWAVNTGNIQRSFTLDTRPDDYDFDELWAKAEKGNDYET